MNRVLRVEGLSKSFSGRPAVSNLSFEVFQGEIFGLLGHNGAGKSTTFGMVLGHVLPDAGKVDIAGVDALANRAKALRAVGAIFEAPAFYDYMSGRENLACLTAWSGGVPRSRIEEAAGWVGLGSRIGNRVKTYSHGMRQRLALAQALLPEPEILLLDEPTEGLDPLGIREMREMILRLRDERGLTVLLSSHLLPEVELLCDRIAILDHGNLLHCGPWRSEGNRWVLELDDWDRAAGPLGACGARVEGREVVLPAGVDVADLISALVAGEVRVGGVARAKKSLEDFYMERAAR